MSREAKTALINTGTNRQGAKVHAGPALQEMKDLGLVGQDGGLTRKGSIVREREMEAALNF